MKNRAYKLLVVCLLALGAAGGARAGTSSASGLFTLDTRYLASGFGSGASDVFTLDTRGPYDAASGALLKFAGVVTDVGKTHAGMACVQTLSGAWGVWCDLPSEPELAVGDLVTVAGVFGIEDGERRLATSSCSKAGTSGLPALGVIERAAGGGPAGSLPGVKGGSGVNNSGLLIRLAGRVAAVDSAAQPEWFTLWDGSAVTDAEGNAGVRVRAPGMALPAVGEFVTVTGISGCQKSGDDLYPLVRVRAQEDIQVVAP